MSVISYKDLVNDLSHVLISFVEPMNLSFYFEDTEISIAEVFSKSGFMPIFLYDKQDFINYSLRYKKIDKLEIDAFAQLHFQRELNSYLNLTIDIVHNLFNEDLFQIDNSIYDSTLYSLAAKILSDQDLIFDKHCIYLDSKYDHFITLFNEKHVQENPIIEKIKGELS